MFRSSRKRKVALTVAALVMCTAATLVYAAWTTDGAGAGYAKAGKAVDLTTVDVSASAAALPGRLYPGTDGDVVIQIHNPNDFPVRVTQIASSGPVTASGGNGTCTTTGVTLNSPQTVSIDVPANSDSTEVTLDDAAHMSSASDNGCQNATFTIPVTLTGSSQP